MIRGALSPALELALHFDLRDSRLGAQRLAGKGDIDLRGKLLRKIDVDLDAAGNRLSATGAFGKAGDSMRLKLQAPKLEGHRLGGAVRRRLGRSRHWRKCCQLEVSGEVRAGQLRIANWFDLRDLSLEGQSLRVRKVLRGQLRCAACSMPELG